jgi:hypothetical protein
MTPASRTNLTEASFSDYSSTDETERGTSATDGSTLGRLGDDYDRRRRNAQGHLHRA